MALKLATARAGSLRSEGVLHVRRRVRQARHLARRLLKFGKTWLALVICCSFDARARAAAHASLLEHFVLICRMIAILNKEKYYNYIVMNLLLL